MAEETTANNQPHGTRAQIAEQLARYEQDYPQLPRQRQLAEALDLPRRTLQSWLERRATLEADPALIAFFESPVGVACLPRLAIGAPVGITRLGAGDIRLGCPFLELTGLAPFVASSSSAQPHVARAVEDAGVAFGQTETQRWGTDLSLKPITVCEDETLHPTPCLVAIAPASGFMLLEKYTDDRQADTWTQGLAEATQGLRVAISQSPRDEGRSLCQPVEQDLSGHHSPDWFPVEQALVQGCRVALARRQRPAVNARVAALAKNPTGSETAAPPAANPGASVGGEPPAPQRQALPTIAEQQERVKRAVQGLPTAYHPFDLKTGQARSAAQLSEVLAQHVADSEAVATEAHRPERCLIKIRKATRVVVKRVAPLPFFGMRGHATVEA